MIRAALLRTSELERVLALTMHHIVSDGWSNRILIRETAALYEAFVFGRQSPLKELAVQYADYGEWQRGWLKGEELDRQINYWKEQLAEAPEVLYSQQTNRVPQHAPIEALVSVWNYRRN